MDVLMTFYGKILVWEIRDNQDRKFIGEFLYPPHIYNDCWKYEWETTEDMFHNKIRLDNIIDKLAVIVNSNKEKYDRIEIIWDVDENNVNSFYRIVGIKDK